MQTSRSDQIRAAVRQAYGAVATQERQSGCCGGGSSCYGPTGSSSRQLGYTDADLAAVPDGADLGLGCGNPQAMAGLRPGEAFSTSGVAPDSTPSSPLNKSVGPAMSSAWT